jgi:hypothetical protein
MTMLKVLELDNVDRMEAEDFFRKRSFAANFAMGMPGVRAARAAGFEKVNRTLVAKLIADPFVVEEIEKVFSSLRAKTMQEKELILAQLDEDRNFAYDNMVPAAAIAATVAKAKILGLMDKPSDQKNMPTKISIEWGDAEGQSETIYEKSNPLLFEAVKETVGNG